MESLSDEKWSDERASEQNWAVCGKLTMILVSRMYGSVTVDEYILGEFRYKYSNTKRQFLEFAEKSNFHEAKWSWQFVIFIVNYFTIVMENLLRDLTS